MTFFFHKAKQADPGVEERDFRYPGPKPASKETAVLMLADAVEAAARSLTEPTPSRIRGVVTRILDARLEDGQLDESPITFEDLAKIRESFIPLQRMQSVVVTMFSAVPVVPMPVSRIASVQ